MAQFECMALTCTHPVDGLLSTLIQKTALCGFFLFEKAERVSVKNISMNMRMIILVTEFENLNEN